MQVQLRTTRAKPEPHMAKSEYVQNGNGQELDPAMMKCTICREYAHSLSQNDTSSALSVSIKGGKYMVYQKRHIAQQQQSNHANEQSKQSDSKPTDGPKQDDNKILLSATTILTLPTEIRLMIYASLFNSLTTNTLSRATSYPLPPLLRANSVLRAESLQEWGTHLEKVVAEHKEVLGRNEDERKKLSQQRVRGLYTWQGVNIINLDALMAANAGQKKAVAKRVDKLRLLQAHHMLAESGMKLGKGGSGDRWRDGRV